MRTNAYTTIKPQLQRCEQWLASVEADAKLTTEDKARLLSLVEGLVGQRADKWRERRAHEEARGEK